MKLSKKGWMLLGIGILVVAFASLGTTYLRQSNEQKRLEAELSLAEERLDEINVASLYSEEDELVRKLSQLKSQLASDPAKVILSQDLESIDSTDSLFDIAYTCNVNIVSVSSAGVGNGKLESLDCFALPITVTAEGDVANLINYIDSLCDDFTNGTVVGASIQVPKVIEEEEVVEEEYVIDWFQPEEIIQSILQSLSGQVEEEEEEPKQPQANIQLIMYNYKDGQL